MLKDHLIRASNTSLEFGSTQRTSCILSWVYVSNIFLAPHLSLLVVPGRFKALVNKFQLLKTFFFIFGNL